MCAINFNVATHTLFIIIDRWWSSQPGTPSPRGWLSISTTSPPIKWGPKSIDRCSLIWSNCLEISHRNVGMVSIDPQSILQPTSSTALLLPICIIPLPEIGNQLFLFESPSRWSYSQGMQKIHQEHKQPPTSNALQVSSSLWYQLLYWQPTLG